MNTSIKSTSGFSLVEILVAMVIALLGTIIIFQVFSASEGIKRTTTSGGDAQQNGLLALYSIERDARMAGFNINFPPLLGCTVLAYDAAPPARDFSFRLAAAEIIDGASGAPDSLRFVFGNSDLLLAPAKLTSASSAASTSHKVDNRYGYRTGDLVIAAEIGGTKNCSLQQATSLPDTSTDDVVHDVGTYTTAAGGTATARYNKSGGLGVDYETWDNTSQSGGRLFNIGAAPSVLTYTIDSTQLTLQNVLSSSTPSPIADGIVQLQAQYGKDTDGDGNVDIWEATMSATPTATDWSRILALRVAVVARSNLPEKPNQTTGECDTTTAEPTWPGGTLKISTDPEWKCYRYRVFETTIPLRNQIWQQLS